jgi:DNA polymerase III delta subunit
MSWSAFEKAVESGKLPALIVFHGPETALRERGLAMVRVCAPDATVVRFEGDDLSKLHEELVTRGLFAERKIVAFEPEAFPAEWLAEYAQAPADGALLLVFAGGGRAPKAPAGALVVSCEPPKGAQLAAAIEREAGRHGKRIDARAADRLADRLGGGWAGLEAEIEKLARYVGSRDRIAERDIEAMVADEQVYRAFDLVDRIVEGDAGEALRILHRLLDQGEAPPMLMGSVGWQIRKMLQVRREMAAGAPAADACAAAGVRWKQAEFARRASRVSLETLQECHDRLLETDLSLKTSGGVEEPLLEGLVVRLCGALAPKR